MHREISWRVAALALAQTVITLATVAGAILWKIDGALAACFGLLGAIAAHDSIRGRAGRSVVLAAGITILLWGYWLARLDGLFDLRPYFIPFGAAPAALFFITAAGIKSARERQGWNGLALAWMLGASTMVLLKSYVYPHFYPFHWAIAAIVATLVASRVLLNLPGVAIQVVHTTILLLIGFPVVDAILRPSANLESKPQMVKAYYSFEAAKEDPASFGLWWQYFVEEWKQLHKEIAIPDREGVAQYRMKPDTRVKFFDSEIVINSLGFRGPEIQRDKEDAYRIVAIGESTTFGCTISDEGKPWPRVLERMLREEIETDRPIEVINAGIYGLTLEENVRRLKKRLLPLKPDMVISYHGYNFFHTLNPAIPMASGKAPPAYIVRPLRLLADFEHQVKLRLFQWQRVPPINLKKPASDPMNTRYADAYNELIQICKTEGIRLVLANYSMAVNAESEPEVIEFYRCGFPTVLADIQANRAHAEIVAELADRHPSILHVDTHAALDGQHEKFIDLVHFTQEGRRGMARTFLETIRPVVEEALNGARHTKGKTTQMSGGAKEAAPVKAALVAHEKGM